MAVTLTNTPSRISTASGTSHSASLGFTPTAGRTLVVGWASQSSSVTFSNIDSAWTVIDQNTNATRVHGCGWALKVSDGTETVFTLDTSSSQALAFTFLEFDGLDGTSPFEASAESTANQNSTNATTGTTGTTGTLGVSDGYALSFFCSDGGSGWDTGRSYTNGSSELYADTPNNASTPAFIFAGKTLSSTTGFSETISTTDAGDGIYGSVVVFKQAAAVGYTLTCAAGSYTLTGQSAALLASRRLAAEQGSYALTGQAATLQRSQRLAAEPGTYSLTGQAAGLRAARRLVAAAGSYALTGVAAILARSRVLAAEQGAYVLTGQAAGLTYTAPGSYVLACDAGSYSLNGQAVNLRAARRLLAAQGSYTLTGQAAGLSKIAGYTLAADAGSYTLTGQTAGLARTRVLQCAAGAYTLTGQAATLTYSGVQAPVLSVAPLGRLLSTAARPPAVSSVRRPANLSTRTR